MVDPVDREKNAPDRSGVFLFLGVVIGAIATLAGCFIFEAVPAFLATLGIFW